MGVKKGKAAAVAAIKRRQKKSGGWFRQAVAVAVAAIGLAVVVTVVQAPSTAETVQLTIDSVLARAQNAKCKDREDSHKCANFVVSMGCDSGKCTLSTKRS